MFDLDGSYMGPMVSWDIITKQKRLQERLEAEMKAVGHAMPVIEFEPDGSIITATESFLHAMDYTLDEIKGRSHSLFVTDAYRASSDYRAFWDKLNAGQFVADKFLRVGKGGKEVWIQASYNPIMGADGKVAKVVKFATDITAQELLAREAAYKSAAFAGSSVAMMIVDRDFKVTYVNEATRRLLTDNLAAFRTLWPNFSPETIVGTCIDTFHKNPAHQRQMLADTSRLPHRTDISVGDLKFALNVSAVLDSKGAYVGNVLEWDNVTATRLNAGMLKALDRSQAIIEFNLDGTIVNANENFCATLGYSLGEIQGKHHSMFVEPAYRASPEYRAFWESLARGEFQAAKYLRIGKGGKEIWIQASYNPIMDGNGKPYKVVKFAADVTDIENERKAAERAAEQAEVVASHVANHANPETPELEDFGEVMLRGDGGTGYIRVDWHTPKGLGVWGDGRLVILGTEGYIELRKYIDIDGRPDGGSVAHSASSMVAGRPWSPARANGRSWKPPRPMMSSPGTSAA